MFKADIMLQTSHICSWKSLRSFSISSAISAPVISVLIIPCCLACSRFSFSIFVLKNGNTFDQKKLCVIMQNVCILSQNRFKLARKVLCLFYISLTSAGENYLRSRFFLFVWWSNYIAVKRHLIMAIAQRPKEIGLKSEKANCICKHF